MNENSARKTVKIAYEVSMRKMLFRSVVSAALLAGFSLQAKPLKIWISSAQDQAYYEEMVTLYQKKVDKDFTAEVEAFGFQEMPDKLSVAIKTGINPPDIVQLDEVFFGMYLSDVPPFVDLTDRVKASPLATGIHPKRMPLFSKGNRVYGIPQSLSAQVLYYRTDLFKKYNITPDDLKTWDDFVKVGERLAAKDQAMMGLDPTFFEILLRQRGSDILSPDGKPYPDRALAIDTLNFLRDLQTKGIGLRPYRGSVFDPVFFSSTVEEEKVICLLGADWYGLDMLQQFTPTLAGKWGVMPLPAWKNADGTLSPRTSTFAGQGMLIYKDCPQVDAAWKFIDFVMTDTEANVQRYLQGNSFTAFRPAWKDPRMLEPNAFFAHQSLGQLLVDLAPDVPAVVMHAKRPKAMFVFQESMYSTFMDDQMTAEELVDQMTEIINSP